MSRVDENKRSFIKGGAASVGVGIAASIIGVEALAETKNSKSLNVPDLNLPPGVVSVTVEILWIPSNKPVEGARVYDHKPNKLIGKTDENGQLKFESENGTIIRLVEPEYGLQQALRIVQGELRSNSDIRVASMGEGWTLPG